MLTFRRLALSTLLAIVVAMISVRATGTNKSESAAHINAQLAVGATMYTNDQSFHNMRVVLTQEFQWWDGNDYHHCDYWPPSECSWASDTGTVYTNSLTGGLTTTYGPTLGRMVTWADYYFDGQFDGNATLITAWP